MQYSIEYLPDENVIDIKLSGRLNFQTAEQFSKEAIKYAKQNACSKFLIDHSDTDIESGIYKLHTAGSELQQFGFTQSHQIAIIVSKPLKKKDMPESDAGNSRWPTIKYFDDESKQKAIDWLLEN